MPQEIFIPLNDIDSIIAKYPAGSRVTAYLGIPKILTADEVRIFQEKLVENGLALAGPVEFGSTDDWPNALRVSFITPERVGVRALPLAVLLLLSAGAIGVTSFLGVRLGDVITQISKNLLPIVLIAGGVFLAYAFIQKKA